MSPPPSDAVRANREPGLSWDDCRRLLETVTDCATFVVDDAGRIATWSPGATRILGYEEREGLGLPITALHPSDDVLSGERELSAARDHGRFVGEGWRVRKNGSRFWANVIAVALHDEAGETRGFGLVVRDSTARRDAEEELHLYEQRFHHLVDAVLDYAIYVLDPEGRVTTWNSGATRVKGYTAGEIIGKHFSLFYTLEDRAAGKPQGNLDAVRRHGRLEDEGFRVRKDGSRFWANVVITPLRDESGQIIGFAKVTRDLTARREAEETERRLIRERTAREVAQEAERRVREGEERYRALSERLEAANRAKDEFLATVSHELRTPLSAILGWSTLLKDRVEEPAVAKALDVIHRNARAQIRIIDDILDVSRVITGKFRLETKPADLVTIVREAIEVVRPSFLAKRIDVTFTPSSAVCLLVADPERLQQVVWNLLSNAVKFTDAGGAIRLTLSNESSNVVLTVSDTGRGIDSAFLPFVFDRFKQADSSTTRRVGGLGLGLALVRHIVELHGGRVAAASDGTGKGATFTVALPVRAVLPSTPEALARHRESSHPSAKPASLVGIRVLVVDDEPDARELIATVLGEAGAVVETAACSAEGLAAFRRFRPHVLVSDIGMPGEDGFAFMHRVRALPAAQGGAVPSLALTAFTREEDRTRAIEAGYTTHIGKPVNPFVLASAVANLSAVTR